MKKALSVFLSVIMLMQFGINSSASFDATKLSESEWLERYNSLVGENTLPTLNVGADETQVSLCWHASKSVAKAEVRLSKNADMSDFVLFTGETTPAENDVQLVCRVNITGLEENTVYYYQWNVGGSWSSVEKYETKSFSKHKAIVVGDIQITEAFRDDGSEQISDGRNWNNVLAEALGKNPDISYLVSPGDNTSTGETPQEWQTLLMPESLRGLPMALAIGNHDKKGMTYEYYTNMPNEYYGKNFEGLDRDFWFRYGDVLYLVFDSTSGNAPDHRAMAKEAVRLNPDAKWRIGVVHHGIYGAGDCIGDMETEILLKTIFAPIFESFDFDLVITGHTHSQGRSHFLKNTKVSQKAESGQTYTDPDGVVYLNSNSACGRPENESYEADYLAYSFLENDVTTYTTLEFDSDTMTLKTFRGDNSELLDSLTIVHAQEFNEKSFGNMMKRFFYKIVEALGWIYTKIDSLVRKVQAIKEDGVSVSGKKKTDIFIQDRADPYVTKGADGWYYFTASYPMYGGSDTEGYDRVVLRRSRTVDGLAQAEEKVIWDEKDYPDVYRYIWAPEIHEINGKWYVFFAASDSENNVWDIRPHVIMCEGDPYTDEWIYKGTFQACEGDNFSFRWFSLDLTYFESGGKSYVSWAQTDGNSNVHIVTDLADEG